MVSRVVVALGGNALGNTPDEQMDKIRRASVHVADFICEGYQVILTHGNGPQVGMINLAFEESSKINKRVPAMKLPECAAMSQGYIGYHIENAVQGELTRRGLDHKIATIITRTEVDPADPAFSHPSKPIGNHYTKREIEEIAQKDASFTYMEDSGRGYRRIVPSPYPQNIVGVESIIKLVDEKFIVIACGGGGIPVIRSQSGDYRGVDAVIDKDLASAKLAHFSGANYLLMVTSVDAACINWGKPEQTEIKRMSATEAKKYCKEGQFAAGSMLPKVQAGIEFVSTQQNHKAIICSMEKMALAIKGQSGTEIYAD